MNEGVRYPAGEQMRGNSDGGSDELPLMSPTTEGAITGWFRRLAQAHGAATVLAEEARQGGDGTEKGPVKNDVPPDEAPVAEENAEQEPYTKADWLASIFSEGPDQVGNRLNKLGADFERVLENPPAQHAAFLQSEYRTLVSVWTEIFDLSQRGQSLKEIRGLLTEKYKQEEEGDSVVGESATVVSESDLGVYNEKRGEELTVPVGGDDGVAAPESVAVGSAEERSNPSPLRRLSILRTIFAGGAEKFHANLDKIEQDYASIKEKNQQNQALVESIIAAERDVQEVIYDFYSLEDTEPDPQKRYELLLERYREQSGWVKEDPHAPSRQEVVPATGRVVPEASASPVDHLPDALKGALGTTTRNWWGGRGDQGNRTVLVNLKGATANREILREKKGGVREEGFFKKLRRKSEEVAEKTREIFGQVSSGPNFSDVVFGQVVKTTEAIRSGLLWVKKNPGSSALGVVSSLGVGVLGAFTVRYVFDGVSDWPADFNALSAMGSDYVVVPSDSKAEVVLENFDRAMGSDFFSGGDKQEATVLEASAFPAAVEQEGVGEVPVRGSDQGAAIAEADSMLVEAGGVLDEAYHYGSVSPDESVRGSVGVALADDFRGESVAADSAGLAGEVVDPGMATTSEARSPVSPLGTEPLIPREGSSLWKLLAERLQDNEIFKALPTEGKNNVIANILQKLKSLPADELLGKYGLNSNLRVSAGVPIEFKDFKPADMLEILEVAKNRYIK